MSNKHTLKSISETTGLSVTELSQKLAQSNITVEDSDTSLSAEAISLLTGQTTKSKLSLGSLKTLSLTQNN